MTASRLAAWLGSSPRVLDGAMAGELLRRGVASAGRLWGAGALMESPEQVDMLHREYIASGAEALTANTFRIAPYSLRRVGLESQSLSLAHLAVALARQAARESGALVLASQTTLEDCYRPDLVPESRVLDAEHAATAALLAGTCPDALLLETFNTVREAVTGSRAAVATGLPVILCVACGPGGKLLSGEDARQAAEAVSETGVAAVGVNCTAVPDTKAALERLVLGSSLPLVAYANNGWFAADSPWLAGDRLGPEAFAGEAATWRRMGVRILGGCCGTGPEHIAALSRLLRGGGRAGLPERGPTPAAGDLDGGRFTKG